MQLRGLAAVLAMLAAAAGCDACAGQRAPPGTSSFYCTCECGVFVLGVPLPDQSGLSPRFEVCFDEDRVPPDGRLYARDVVGLCDEACRDTISEAVRRVACIDRPDLCETIACSEDVCRSATDDNHQVFDPRVDDAGTLELPDGGLVGFGFAEACRVGDAGFAACREVECALGDVRGDPVCGDLVKQEGEPCDGPCTIFEVCPSLVPGSHGFVGCSDACELVTESCVPEGQDAGADPDGADCVAQNEQRLQRKILDVLAGCSVIPAAQPTEDCEREATRPICLVP